MSDKNSFNIEGVLYAKDTRIVENKKEPTKPPYEFRSIKLEIKRSYLKRDSNGIEQQHSISEIPEFHLGNGVGFDDFDIGDLIDVRFSLSGKKISDTWWKSELRCTYLKHADLDADGHRPGKAKPYKPIKIDSHIPTPEELSGEEDNDLPF